jgi:hypothetical protein
LALVRAGEELQEVRLLLRQPHLAARRVAVGIISSWDSEPLGSVDFRAVLAAASERYPLIPNDASRPAEQLARLLWTQPHCVAVHEVVDAVLKADMHARWALVQLLVLRHDTQGVQAVQFLLSMDGFVDVMGPPADSVFDSYLQYSSVAEPERPLDLSALVQVFAGLLSHPGWTRQIAAFLQQLQQHGRLHGVAQAQVFASASELATAIVADCNTAVHQSISASASGESRRTLSCLAALLASFLTADDHSSLYRMLGSADPLVSVIGVVALTDCGRTVGADRIEVLARDLEALGPLFHGLDALGATELIPSQYRVPQLLAQADVVEWLSQESELGRSPDEIEPLGSWQLLDAEEGEPQGHAPTSDCGSAEVELIRFRMNDPHWSSGRGWMVGVAGAWTHSCYYAEDELTAEEHIASLQLAAGNW